MWRMRRCSWCFARFEMAKFITKFTHFSYYLSLFHYTSHIMYLLFWCLHSCKEAINLNSQLLWLKQNKKKKKTGRQEQKCLELMSERGSFKRELRCQGGKDEFMSWPQTEERKGRTVKIIKNVQNWTVLQQKLTIWNI